MNPFASVRYGVDAPGVSGPRPCCFRQHPGGTRSDGFAIPRPDPIPTALNIGAALVAALLLFYAAIMLRSSLVSKTGV